MRVIQRGSRLGANADLFRGYDPTGTDARTSRGGAVIEPDRDHFLYAARRLAAKDRNGLADPEDIAIELGIGLYEGRSSRIGSGRIISAERSALATSATSSLRTVTSSSTASTSRA